MREFVVSLRTGKRYTVRADRVTFPDAHTVALLPAAQPGAPADAPVAVFDRGLVVAVVAADHLVAEADEPDVIAANIPF